VFCNMLCYYVAINRLLCFIIICYVIVSLDRLLCFVICYVIVSLSIGFYVSLYNLLIVNNIILSYRMAIVL